MTNELPDSDLPSPSKAEAQLKGLKEELENRAGVARKAREEAEKEVSQTESERKKVEDEYRKKIAELERERRRKHARLKSKRNRAKRARSEAKRMDAIMRFAKGEIGFFKLFVKTVF